MNRLSRVPLTVGYAILSMAIALWHFNAGAHPTSWWMALIPPFVVCMLAPRTAASRGLFSNVIGLTAVIGMLYWGFWMGDANKGAPLCGFILHGIAAVWAFRTRAKRDPSESGASSGL